MSYVDTGVGPDRVSARNPTSSCLWRVIPYLSDRAGVAPDLIRKAGGKVAAQNWFVDHALSLMV
jgi:hypothetical protein